METNRIVCVLIFLFVICHLVSGQSDSKWKDIGFNWLEPKNWKWDFYGYDKELPPAIFNSTPGRLRMYSHNPLDENDWLGGGPIFTRVPYGAENKAFYIEWIANDRSNTVFEILSEELMSKGQFGDNCWPYCGEIDVWEMFRADNNSYSKAYGAPANWGAMTLHKECSSKGTSCPVAGPNQIWYQDTKPMVSSCSAHFQNLPAQKNSMVTVIDKDQLGQYIQFIQFPVLVSNGDETYSITLGPNSIATTKIYNNETAFYGNKAEDCDIGGHSVETGWPFYPQKMHFILWEGKWLPNDAITGGYFEVTDFRILLPPDSADSATTLFSMATTGLLCLAVLLQMLLL